MFTSGLHGWVAWTRKAIEQYVTVRFTESSWVVVAKFSETKTTQFDAIEVEILVFFFFFFFHLLWFKPWIKQLANLLSTEKYYNVVSPLTFCGNIFDVAIFFSGMKFESDCSVKPLACKMIIDTALTPDSGVKRAGDRKIRNDFEIISIGFVALSRSMAVISTRNCFGKVRFLQTLTGRICNWFSFTFTT